MAFNSLTFLIFLVIILFLYWLPFSWRARKVILLLGSYLFYCAWNPPFVSLVIISTVVDWIAAKKIYVSVGKRRLFWLLVTLVVNLGLLAYFKYGTFLFDNFVSLSGLLGIDYEPAPLSIILPMGISFYTFQTLSYSFDIYRGKSEPSRSFLDYALFVTFFPQLVAGPIVRAVDFIPQCYRAKHPTSSQLGWGLILLTTGLFQKIVLADGLFAPMADRVYAEPELASTATAWMGTIAFSGQILYDFAGYSTCAIGIALCLGFALPDNFRYPYAAIGFSDFWRRWHISLSSWLRDYLYISLGGNRRGEWMRARNVMLTMLIGGLWHGANWTFVVWGGIHGGYLVAEQVLRKTLGHWNIWSQPFIRFLLALCTFFAVVITWVFFRAQDFTSAAHIISAMFGGGVPSWGAEGLRGPVVVLVFCLLVIYQWFMRETNLEELFSRLPRPVMAIGIAGAIVTMLLIEEDSHGFIYFQF